jgi:hypothetical protein
MEFPESDFFLPQPELECVIGAHANKIFAQLAGPAQSQILRFATPRPWEDVS